MAIALDFTGKVAVIVGGTSGINRGIAKCFASHGAKVAVASRKQEKVDETVNELRALGAQAMGFSADVREPDALEAGMQAVHERFGDFDVVVLGPKIKSGEMLKGKIVGIYHMIDEKGFDPHLVVSPVDDHGRALFELTDQVKQDIASFVDRYKVPDAHKGKWVWVTFDPVERRWVVRDEQDKEIRRCDAPEVSREAIVALQMCYEVPSRPAAYAKPVGRGKPESAPKKR